VPEIALPEVIFVLPIVSVVARRFVTVAEGELMVPEKPLSETTGPVKRV
jgi:hypothetical protein